MVVEYTERKEGRFPKLVSCEYSEEHNNARMIIEENDQGDKRYTTVSIDGIFLDEMTIFNKSNPPSFFLDLSKIGKVPALDPAMSRE